MDKQPASLDFIVVGAEKCGTTWLATMLKQHPQIFLPEQKELHYFNRKFVEFPDLKNYNFDKPIEWYLSFFKDADSEKIKGEICPSYLWDENAAQRIFAFDPKIKIVMILRDPVERTYSAYRFYVQRGVIHQDFKHALQKFEEHLLIRSLYYEQVKRYFALFPKQNIHVILYEDLATDSAKVLTEVEKFLGVDQYFPPNINERSYVTGTVQFSLINKLLAMTRYYTHKFHLSFLLDVSRLAGLSGWLEQLRQKNKRVEQRTEIGQLDTPNLTWLRDHFRSDVEKLEQLISRDLTLWK